MAQRHRTTGIGGSMRFPRSTLLPGAAYSNREAAFHVTINAHPKLERLPDSVARLVWDTVLEQQSGQRVELIAACLMPNHIHMVLRPNAMDVLAFVRAWKSHTTRLSWTAGLHGALWQPKMWDRALRNAEHLTETLRYVIENPVAAGLVDSWEAWPFTLLSDDA